MWRIFVVSTICTHKFTFFSRIYFFVSWCKFSVHFWILLSAASLKNSKSEYREHFHQKRFFKNKTTKHCYNRMQVLTFSHSKHVCVSKALKDFLADDKKSYIWDAHQQCMCYVMHKSAYAVFHMQTRKDFPLCFPASSTSLDECAENIAQLTRFFMCLLFVPLFIYELKIWAFHQQQCAYPLFVFCWWNAFQYQDSWFRWKYFYLKNPRWFRRDLGTQFLLQFERAV